MTEAVYFAVVKWLNRERPQRFHDLVPPGLTKRGSPLVYCTRLDTLPDGDRLIQTPLWKLMVTYRAMKKAGKLPPENRGPKPRTEGGPTKLATGERYRFLQATWDRDSPAYPPLADPAWLAGVGSTKKPVQDAPGRAVEEAKTERATTLPEDRTWAVGFPWGSSGR
jgi:hypothetical protein